MQKACADARGVQKYHSYSDTTRVTYIVYSRLLFSFISFRPFSLAMVSVINKIDSNHDDLVHDAQANYLGTRLATCGADSKVKIFELNGSESKLLVELNGHEGPVWGLDWAHPEFDDLLATCSYDRKVIIWKETNGDWQKHSEHKQHDSSVNCVQWAPREYGLMLACASSDGSISVLRYTDDGDWESRKIPQAHSHGVNAISWAPPISSVSTIYKNTEAPDTSTMSRSILIKRFVSGGCDSLAKIWRYREEEETWVEEKTLEAHSDWVRDVAWAPSIGLSKWFIATCSQDKKVIIWTNELGPSGHEWESKILNFENVVWHVSWSVLGNILAVSSGDNQVSLFKESMSGEFERISNIETSDK